MLQARVHIATYNLDRNAWLNHQERRLIECHELSDQRYVLTDDPEEADIILVVDVWEDVWSQGPDVWLDNVGQHPLFARYPRKSFAISDMDSPVVLHHGIYPGAEKGLLTKGRVRAGSYGLYFDYLTNPFIEGYVPDPANEAPKRYLFSLIGRDSHPVRRQIFDTVYGRQDVLLEDTSAVDFFRAQTDPAEVQRRQKQYFEVLLESKFALCPRGSGASSLRLFEALQLGVSPVIISDRWLPPLGIKWSEFSVIVKERDVRHLDRIVAEFEPAFREMGRLARQAHEQHFGKDVYFNYLIDSCLAIRDGQILPEPLYHAINPIVIRWLKLKNRLRIRTRIRGWRGPGWEDPRFVHEVTSK